jgi:hypothetical protein
MSLWYSGAICSRSWKTIRIAIRLLPTRRRSRVTRLDHAYGRCILLTPLRRVQVNLIMPQAVRATYAEPRPFNQAISTFGRCSTYDDSKDLETWLVAINRSKGPRLEAQKARPQFERSCKDRLLKDR